MKQTIGPITFEVFLSKGAIISPNDAHNCHVKEKKVLRDGYRQPDASDVGQYAGK
jgi:hypothetical protein